MGGERWGEEVVRYLQELVGVRLHELGVHLAVLQGGRVGTDMVMGE